MGTAPRKTVPYGTVEYYRDRIAGWQEELALGRYRRCRLGGQPHRPERIQTLRKWIKDDRDRLIEAFANQRAGAGDIRPLRRLNWIRYVRALRDSAERLVQYAQAQQQDLERVEESLRIGARRGRATARPYAASTLKRLAAHQRRRRKSLEKILAQIAALPSKAPIPYREWFHLAAADWKASAMPASQSMREPWPSFPVTPPRASPQVSRHRFDERVIPSAPASIGKLLKVILWVLAGAVLAGVLVSVLGGIHSDFHLHYNFGKRFLEGTFIYAGGLHVPYPPFWALFWAPWTILSLEAARVVALVVLGFGSLTTISLVLVRIGQRSIPAPDDRVTIALIVALVLGARFSLRDLTEGGPNFFLWAVVWVGILLYLGRRRVAGGMLIGVSIALKMTPAILLPYFLLKREWRTPTAALVTAVVLTASPGLFQPSQLFWQEMRTWTGNAWHEVTAADSSQTILGQAEIRNLSLRQGLARLLRRYPPGHRLFVKHPGFVQFLDLSPRAAGWLVRGLMLAFLGLVAWRFRRRASDAGHPMVLPLELATMSALALLYSPITWKQHCVSLLPALFFLALCSLQWNRVSRWMWCALLYYLVFALALTRDTVGRPFSILLESYQVVTWAILLLVILLLVWHRRILSSHGTGADGGNG